MSDAPKKCAHTGCSCMAEAGSKYCSMYCKDSAGTTTLGCDCKHPGCSGHM
jgi:hypothetical protein